MDQRDGWRRIDSPCSGVRELNFKYMPEGKGATVAARSGKDGITLCDPSRTDEGADRVLQRIYDWSI